MKLLKTYKKLHIWLLADLGLLAAYWLCRGNRAWMNALAAHVTAPLRRAIGRICYRVDFSVAEALCVLLVVLAAAYVLWSVIAVIRRRGHGALQRAYGAVLGAVCAALTIYVGFCFLLGIDSYADGFQEKSGLYAQPVALEDLQAVTAYFARQVAQTAPGVARDEDGVFAEDRRAILENSVRAYDALEKEYPFLAFDDTGIKPVYFSRFLSALDFTGIYCPFTGESNVNVDSPASMLPATAAHELAHQRGITSEQECNFLAILASTTCGDEVYAYSGWLSGYIYLGNALYRVDPEAYWAIRSALPETVQADLRYQNEYWDQFEDKAAQKVSNRVYDSFLKGYGQELGLQSYGTVVDLLVTYYKDRI
ncbi:MAG: DUF3810 domain-containing protein [Oscillospiraceae bacterium]|nr:DUF3810 domain-containing protein [Oscillospiraceae bacterium]